MQLLQNNTVSKLHLYTWIIHPTCVISKITKTCFLRSNIKFFGMRKEKNAGTVTSYSMPITWECSCFSLWNKARQSVWDILKNVIKVIQGNGRPSILALEKKKLPCCMTPMHIMSTIHRTNYSAMESMESPFIASCIIPLQLFTNEGLNP